MTSRRHRQLLKPVLLPRWKNSLSNDRLRCRRRTALLAISCRVINTGNLHYATVLNFRTTYLNIGSSASSLCIDIIACCPTHPSFNHWRSSFSGRCCPTVEHSAAERHVGVVDICFQETFEDASLQSFFPWISYSACALCHFGHYNRSCYYYYYYYYIGQMAKSRHPYTGQSVSCHLCIFVSLLLYINLFSECVLKINIKLQNFLVKQLLRIAQHRRMLLCFLRRLYVKTQGLGNNEHRPCERLCYSSSFWRTETSDRVKWRWWSNYRTRTKGAKRIKASQTPKGYGNMWLYGGVSSTPGNSNSKFDYARK